MNALLCPRRILCKVVYDRLSNTCFVMYFGLTADVSSFVLTFNSQEQINTALTLSNSAVLRDVLRMVLAEQVEPLIPNTCSSVRFNLPTQ